MAERHLLIDGVSVMVMICWVRVVAGQLFLCVERGRSWWVDVVRLIDILQSHLIGHSTT
jgi:hypothetical protein